MVACSALATLLLMSACGAAKPAAVRRPVATTAPKPIAAPARPVALTYQWPLTGLAAPVAPTQPALSVKIDNAPAARPQSGLDSADLVFECLVEGGMSRFMAVFQSHRAAEVGPIRSARPVDGALLRALHGGIFAYSGAASGEIAPAQAYSTAFLLSNDASAGGFQRLTSRYAPENLYSTTDELRVAAAGLSAHPGLPTPLFTYGPIVPGSHGAGWLSVVLGGEASASWVYNGSSYLRSENGTPHLLANGQQVRAANVVVLRVMVAHSGITDAAGNEDPFVLAYGSGAARVLRNGVAEEGHWSRPSVGDPFAFTSTTGGALTLAPGPTWIELVPTDGSVAPA
jgi:hypothetical protein